MNRLPHRSRLIFGLVLCTGLARAGEAPLLPLDAGTFVIASYPRCEEAPLAGVMSFDGHSLVGPHDSNCRTEIIERDGARYRVRTSCRADGAGQPEIPTETVLTIQVESSTAMTVTRPDGKSDGYALCPGFR